MYHNLFSGSLSLLYPPKSLEVFVANNNNFTKAFVKFGTDAYIDIKKNRIFSVKDENGGDFESERLVWDHDEDSFDDWGYGSMGYDNIRGVDANGYPSPFPFFN